jgi:hypothetical protein
MELNAIYQKRALLPGKILIHFCLSLPLVIPISIIMKPKSLKEYSNYSLHKVTNIWGKNYIPII